MLKLRNEILNHQSDAESNNVIELLINHVIALEEEVVRLNSIINRVEANQPHLIGTIAPVS